MKGKRWLLLVLSVVLLITFTIAISACKKGKNEPTDTDTNTDTNSNTNSEQAPAEYTVSFYNETGAILLAEVTVKEGESAIYPHSVPFKPASADTGFIFQKWVVQPDSDIEADITNISNSMSVYAYFIPTTEQHTVTFIDYDGSIIEIQEIFHTNPATEPTQPTRSGYIFERWSSDFNYVVEDLTIQAQYIKQFKVSFLDINGNTIEEQLVTNGKSAIEPTLEPVEGYTFIGWDASFENVTSNMTINAKYEINTYMVTFNMPSGETITTITDVYHGFSVTPPEIDEIYFDWNKMKGYKFTGWDTALDSITSNAVITAQYDEEVTEPIIIVDSSEISRSETEFSVYMYLCGKITMHGLNIHLGYDENLNISNDDIKILTSNLGGSTTSKLDSTNHTYEFCWSSGGSVSSNGQMNMFKFTFTVGQPPSCGYFVIEILDDTYYINENLEKAQPIIISGKTTVLE